jgi:hypothetical protein
MRELKPLIFTDASLVLQRGTNCCVRVGEKSGQASGYNGVLAASDEYILARITFDETTYQWVIPEGNSFLSYAIIALFYNFVDRRIPCGQTHH